MAAVATSPTPGIRPSRLSAPKRIRVPGIRSAVSKKLASRRTRWRRCRRLAVSDAAQAVGGERTDCGVGELLMGGRVEDVVLFRTPPVAENCETSGLSHGLGRRQLLCRPTDRAGLPSGHDASLPRFCWQLDECYNPRRHSGLPADRDIQSLRYRTTHRQLGRRTTITVGWNRRLMAGFLCTSVHWRPVCIVL